MKTLNSIAGCRRPKWASLAGAVVVMLSPISNLKAADEMPPPAFTQGNDSTQAFESFLVYLAEFEDEKGEWMDPMLLEQDDINGGISNE